MTTPDEKAADDSMLVGSKLAKQAIETCMKTPMPFAALSSAASSLLSAGLAMVEKTQSPQLADHWVTVVLASAKQALEAHGIAVTFSFARKP